MFAEDLRYVASLTPASLNALHLASSSTLAPLVARVRPNSDFAPVLDLNGERARYLLTDASGFENLNASPFDIPAALSGRSMSLANDRQALATVPRLQMRARSARLRLFPGDTSSEDADYGSLQQVHNLFESQISAGVPPPQWRRWVSLLYEVNRDLHAGSPGALDTSFFRRVDAFVNRVNAPAPVRQSVDFVRAVDAWDFPMVQAAGDQLIRKMRKGEWWLPPGYLRDATVVAHLKNGDPLGARAAFTAMMPLVGRDAVGDLRSRLLSAHIGAAIAARTSVGVTSRASLQR